MTRGTPFTNRMVKSPSPAFLLSSSRALARFSDSLCLFVSSPLTATVLPPNVSDAFFRRTCLAFSLELNETNSGRGLCPAARGGALPKRESVYVSDGNESGARISATRAGSASAGSGISKNSTFPALLVLSSTSTTISSSVRPKF